jgi:hypothetical protein
MRGQIYFRDQDTTGDGAAVVGGVGILEVPQGWFTEDVVRGVIMMGGPEAFSLSLTNYAADLAGDDDIRAAEIDAAAKRSVWPLPSSLAGDAMGGGLMVRRTRMPSSPGTEIMACIAVLKAPPGRLRREAMYRVEGAIETPDDVSDPLHMPFSGRLTCFSPVPVPELVSRGNHLHQLLKQPVWGFGAEGVAFNSTMSISIIDLCDECMDLAARENLTAEQSQRLDVLRRSEVGFVLHAGSSEPDYLAFRKAMTEEFGPRGFDGVQTASEIAARAEAARRIVRALHAPDEALSIDSHRSSTGFAPQ